MPKIVVPIHLNQNDWSKTNPWDVEGLSVCRFTFSTCGCAARDPDKDSISVVILGDGMRLSLVTVAVSGSISTAGFEGVTLMAGARACSNSASNLSAREEILRLSSPFIFSRDA